MQAGNTTVLQSSITNYRDTTPRKIGHTERRRSL